MIKLTNLDDQVFDDIVETARRRVMQYYPQWTNFNPSDPGLTILELFAWLKEMQQYRLNRITREGVLSCLRLLGMTPAAARCAKTIAVFRQESLCEIPEGFPFATGEGTVFETRTSVTIGDGSVFSVWIDTGDGPAEVGATGEDAGITMQPFGPLEAENACLYVGLFGVKGTRLSLYFDIDDHYPVARTPFGDDMEPSRDIAWEYGPGFDPAKSVTDMTRGLSVSGEVIIDIDEGWQSHKPAPSMPKCYWMRARLVKKGSEESPKINRFFKDYATLYQHETLSRAIDINAEDKNVSLKDHLGRSGEHIIFTAKGDGWKHIQLPASRIKNTDGGTEITTNSGGMHRIVSVKLGFGAMHSTMRSLPGIRIEMPVQGYTDKIGLMIEEGGIWYDWKPTDTLYTAGPYDRVFIVEDESIVFGDNEHGACPPAGTDNVLISDCRMTLGKDGNVLPHVLASKASHELTSDADGTLTYGADNITFGEGGSNPETLEQMLGRMTKLLTDTDRCVTSEDYEKMAAATPGTRIIKTHAAPGYDPKTGGTNIPALVTVVVQPYGTAPLPLPDKRMLRRVERHLDKGRLLTTRIEVAAPEYVPVSVSVSAAATDSEAARQKIKDELTRYLSPTIGPLGIGATVPVADVTALISACRGVSHVISITLGAPENMAAIDRSGNVVLPPHTIAYSGEIDVLIKN